MQNQDGKLEKSNLLAIDFGCSCFLQPGERSFELAGSPMYLAPEAVAVRPMHPFLPPNSQNCRQHTECFVQTKLRMKGAGDLHMGL